MKKKTRKLISFTYFCILIGLACAAVGQAERSPPKAEFITAIIVCLIIIAIIAISYWLMDGGVRLIKEIWIKYTNQIKQRKIIKRIEKVLGFKLYDWQKQYIFNMPCEIPTYRATGKTVAHIIKLSLRDNFIIKNAVLDEYWWEKVKLDGIWNNKRILKPCEELNFRNNRYQIVYFVDETFGIRKEHYRNWFYHEWKKIYSQLQEDPRIPLRKIIF